jgi:membrane fusion protein, multidrug efflux system
MKKILIIAVIVVAGGLVFFLTRNGKGEASGPVAATSVNKGLAAEVILVKDTTLEEMVNVLGTIYANEEVEVASEVAGRLVRINFSEGQLVKKGQLLFKLDDSELQGRLKILEARKNFVSSSVKRMEALFKAEAVSREEYENELNSQEVLDAEIDLIQIQIGKTGILAPFDGKTGIRRISPGAYVNPNTTLVHLEDMGKVKIEFPLPEKYASKIKSGDKVTFTVENDSRTYEGTVNVVDPKIDQTTRSLFVRAVAENKDFMLVPGSSASVTVPIGGEENTLLIPSQALIPNLSGYTVYTVRDGKSVQTTVTVGLRTSNSVQITSGLSKGDTVMTTNLLRVKEGLAIDPVVAND